MTHQRIKTNIKFYQGLDKVENRMYGFVTKVNGCWRGCRDTEAKKKIVFIDSKIINTIVPNMLYSCSLVPMRNDGGFIAKTATPIRFKATITTSCRGKSHQVKVRFGNKMLIYDPTSSEKRKRDIKAIADDLRTRLDLENGQMVAEDFINNACIVKRLYEQSKSHV